MEVMRSGWEARGPSASGRGGAMEVNEAVDIIPRPYALHPVASVVADLEAAGFEQISLRAFFLPQLRKLPAAVLPAVYALERTGPLALLAARRAGRVFCAAEPG